MKLLTIIALSATLLTGVSAASANPFTAMGGFDAINAISGARSAMVLTVNANEAGSLKIDTDNAALKQNLRNNRYLSKTIIDQGYTVDDVVGIDASGRGSNITLYVM